MKKPYFFSRRIRQQRHRVKTASRNTIKIMLPAAQSQFPKELYVVPHARNAPPAPNAISPAAKIMYPNRGIGSKSVSSFQYASRSGVSRYGGSIGGSGRGGYFVQSTLIVAAPYVALGINGNSPSKSVKTQSPRDPSKIRQVRGAITRHRYDKEQYRRR